MNRDTVELKMPTVDVPCRYATPADYEVCRKLHRKFGTTYYFATQRFTQNFRLRTHALYGFVRVADEWVDNPNGLTLSQRASLLADFRSQLIRGIDGVEPTHPVLRAFCDVVREVEMPLDEPLCFLDAMEQDLQVCRYETYEDLQGYMRGSASAVGLMMCYLLETTMTEQVVEGAVALGEAMQLTNFLRDVGEDLRRGRIYLPREDMDRFGVSEAMLLRSELSPSFIQLMKFEMDRARKLYKVAERSIPELPRNARFAVRLALVLYRRILQKIEDNAYDVFSRRARTSKGEKLWTAARLWISENR
jgi:phytoene synthase